MSKMMTTLSINEYGPVFCDWISFFIPVDTERTSRVESLCSNGDLIERLVSHSYTKSCSSYVKKTPYSVLDLARNKVSLSSPHSVNPRVMKNHSKIINKIERYREFFPLDIRDSIDSILSNGGDLDDYLNSIDDRMVLIEVSGNPTKYFKDNNIWGNHNILEELENYYRGILEELRDEGVIFREDFDYSGVEALPILRADITTNMRPQSIDNVLLKLSEERKAKVYFQSTYSSGKMIRFPKKYEEEFQRLDVCRRGNSISTVYLNSNGLKIKYYDKQLEIWANGKVPKVSGVANGYERVERFLSLARESNGLLRVEITYSTENTFNKMGVRTIGDFLMVPYKEDVDACVDRAKVEIVARHPMEILLEEAMSRIEKNNIRRLFRSWVISGEYFCSKNTKYSHRKIILDATGIDILDEGSDIYRYILESLDENTEKESVTTLRVNDDE